MSMRTRARSLLPMLAALSAGGCQLLIGLDGGTLGTGGAGGSSSTSSASSSSTSSSSHGGGGTGGTTTTSTGSGGSTGGGGSTSSSSGTACDGGATCEMPEECADTMNECVLRTCDASCCGTKNADDGTATIAGQTSGDCQRVVCDGAGSTKSVADDLDVPPDQDACHAGACASGSPDQAPRVKGTPCAFDGGKVCGDPGGSSAGKCLECNAATDCTSGKGCVGNACVPTVLLLAAGSGGVIAGEYHAGGTWVTSMLGGASTDEISLAFTTAGAAVGVLRNGSDGGHLWSTSFGAGTWSAPAAITPSMTARVGAAIGAGSSGVQLVFHDTSFFHQHAVLTGSTWSAPQTVGAQTFGPTAAAIAVVGDDATIAYYDGSGAPASNKLTAQSRVGGTWQSKIVLDGDPNFQAEPSIAAMTGTVELLVVYARSDGTIHSVSRSAGTWSAPIVIPGANMSATARPALAALPGGEAVMAFRGNDGFLYWARYSAGAWTGATPFSAPTNVSILGAPALTRGVSGAEAELAMIQTDKKAYHARLASNAWSTPAIVGGANLSSVAMATSP